MGLPLGSEPKASTVQATLLPTPTYLLTHLPLRPKATQPVPLLTLQVAPSSAHLAKPVGLSLVPASAGALLLAAEEDWLLEAALLPAEEDWLLAAALLDDELLEDELLDAALPEQAAAVSWAPFLPTPA